MSYLDSNPSTILQNRGTAEREGGQLYQMQEFSGGNVSRKERLSRFDVPPTQSCSYPSQATLPPPPPVPPFNHYPDALMPLQSQPHFGTAALSFTSFPPIAQPPSSSSSTTSTAVVHQANLNSMSADAFLAQMHDDHIAAPIKDEYGMVY